MHINLGAPYENILETVIKKGYASNQTEVIRQALIKYKEYIMLDNEELKPEYIDKIKIIEKGKFKTVKSVNDLWSE